MSTLEFVGKVSAMREAQKKYFKYRSNEDLRLSKQLEKEVDSIILSLKNGSENDVTQGFLFD